MLPASYDLRTVTDYVPPILDQQELGSCAANEISNSLRFCIGKETGVTSEWQPSRLYIYYFTRLLEESPTNEDTGISIKGGMESISKYGACNETTWPYDISQFATTPSKEAINEAHTHIYGYTYLSVPQDLVHIKQALVAGYPVVIGIQIYESFESDEVAKTGIVPMPDTKTEKCLGGHCVSIFSYNDATQRFTLSNSWGSNWGNNGYFTLPYDYVMNSDLAADFWQAHSFQ
jgi:C1A family cysteine protease